MVERKKGFKCDNLSVTALESYNKCPRLFYFNHLQELPKRTDYPRLFGGEIHQHIAQLYLGKRAEPRKFYFKDRKSFKDAWFPRWQRAQEKAESKGMLRPNTKIAKEYNDIGAACLTMYWDANCDKPLPLYVEKRLIMSLYPGLDFVGVIDQVRIIPKAIEADFIKDHRPDLLVDGKLKEGYDPVVVVDLKTNIYGYDVSKVENKEERYKRQAPLHNNLQRDAYDTLLRRARNLSPNLCPVGFYWWHLRSGKAFFSYSDENSESRLGEVIESVVDGLQNRDFHPSPGEYCKFCDYYPECKEGKTLLITAPEVIFDADPNSYDEVISNVRKKVEHQKSFKEHFGKGFHVERIKRSPPIFVPTSSGKVLLENLPWDQEKSEIQINKEEQRFCGDCGEPMIRLSNGQLHCVRHGSP